MTPIKLVMGFSKAARSTDKETCAGG
jgi:hypothetical protein